MIIINEKPARVSELYNGYENGGLERSILDIMAESSDEYEFSSLEELYCELKLRRAIIKSSEELMHSGLKFRTFSESFCNPDYWVRKSDGGFELKKNALPSRAVNDIYINGQKYGTECATAMQIVYYKALLSTMPPETFDRRFKRIRLMNWDNSDPRLSAAGRLRAVSDHIPGDRRYFNNPDVDPKTPQWQGENAIDMGGGTYYGHGIGRHDAKYIISALNKNRKRGAEESAYLMDAAGRPDFKVLC